MDHIRISKDLKADVLLLCIAVEKMPVLWPKYSERPYLEQAWRDSQELFNQLDLIRRGANQPEVYQTLDDLCRLLGAYGDMVNRPQYNSGIPGLKYSPFLGPDELTNSARFQLAGNLKQLTWMMKKFHYC